MKTRTKSISSLLLAVLMTTTMLAGCGGNGQPTETTLANSDPTAESQGTGDKTIAFPYTGEEIVFKGFGYDGLAQEDTACSREWQEHIGNIKVDWEFIPYSDYMTKTQVYLASGDIPDILPVADVMKVAQTYGAEGTLLDFNQYAEYMPNLQAYREQYPNMDWVNTAEGNRYMIMGVQPIDFSGESYFVNMTELKKCGIEKAPDTIEEMLEDMRIVKEKDPQSVPFASYWNIPYTQNTFAILMNAKNTPVYYDAEAGKHKFTFNEEASKHKELIQLMHDMYAEGLINPEIATISAEQENAILAQGNWAFSFVYSNSMEAEIFKVAPGEALPFDIHPMTPPKSYDGNRYMNLAYLHDGLPSWGIVCDSQTEHPEALAAYMDQVVSPYGRDLQNYGIEGVTYDIVDGKYVMRDVDKGEMGVGTLYEAWIVGMGPTERTSDFTIGAECIELNHENLVSGVVQPVYDPVVRTFGAEAAEEKAAIENDLMTYVNEQEAMFIYGQRDMAEWDQFVEEINNLIDVNRLLELYDSADIIVREPERVY